MIARLAPVLLMLLQCAICCDHVNAQSSDTAVSFDRDIRPILSDTCFQCHGPDEEQRHSQLRLDQRSGLFSDRNGTPVVQPGDPAASLLVQRITSSDPDTKMPPPDSVRRLTAAQIDLLQRWIAQGADWKQHWSFIPVEHPTPPTTAHSDWHRNPIDQFVLAQLEAQALTPSPQASHETLIRRVTLDLTGLPPTLQEVDAFLADNSPHAWETVVDRLLNSPRYGEHMAVAWLDAARYADTSGYQNDGPRSMWRWRDWVIDAFNRNLPYDQFTVEQIAGDLLPAPTLDQRIATGFNRNHRGNAEGGIIPEEYQVEYVVDRVDTTFTVWLGLTMGCARCHDHKYDPLSQQDYYQAFAYFNNLPEYGRAIKEGNSPPYLKAPLPAQTSQLEQLDQELAAAMQSAAEHQPDLKAALTAWEQTPQPEPEPDWSITDQLIAHFPLTADLRNTLAADTVTADTPQRDTDNSTTPQSATPAASTVPPQFTPRHSTQAAALPGDAHIDAGDVGNFGYFDRFTLACWVRPAALNGTIISRMTPVQHGDGYYVHLRDGHVQVNLVKRWLDDCIRVESSEPLAEDVWQHLTVVYDGSRLASGITVYLNGKPMPLDVHLDLINQTFAATKEPLRIGGGQSDFQGGIGDVRVFSRDLSAAEAALLSVPESVNEILQRPAADRSPQQQQKLTHAFLDRHAPQNLQQIFARPDQLRQQHRNLYDEIPTVMVMQEMQTPRQTHILLRGQYDRSGDPVQAAIPSTFAAADSAAAPGTDAASSSATVQQNRLDFARWLVSPQNPLTARVAVNRLWQRFFALGLVRTAEDFGAQGEPPSHPQLLDWLAAEFMSSGWNIKALQKLIVTSATYRQDSRVSADLLQRDPDNRLLARGPRRRLSAEVIRDQALLLSGLLTHKIGGPSVRPYQPDGLWKEIATDTDYQQSHGDDLYRRSLYTYWKRTVAPPTMMTLDATSREACTVSRSRTNTPLQALALMNDITFVEAARVMAQHELQRPADSLSERIVRMFRMVTSRQPQDRERQILEQRYHRSLDLFRTDPAAAADLLQQGEFPLPDPRDDAQLAALTTVASLLLNLDEVITQQ